MMNHLDFYFFYFFLDVNKDILLKLNFSNTLLGHTVNIKIIEIMQEVLPRTLHKTIFHLYSYGRVHSISI